MRSAGEPALHGAMRSFDRAARSGIIRADSGRELFVAAAEIPAKARVRGARVEFAIERRDGRDQAVGVRLLPPDAAPRKIGVVTASARSAGSETPPGRLRPVRSAAARKLLSDWVRAVAARSLDDVLPLYAPDAVLHAAGREWRGWKELRIGLLDSGAMAPGWDPHGYWEGRTLKMRGRPAGRRHAETRLRVSDGRIMEQWLHVVR